MSSPDICIFDWPTVDNQLGSSQHALFNSGALAAAGRLDGKEDFCISIDGNQYLAFKRHASAVVGGLSLDDMSVLLNNMSLVRNALVAMGVRAVSLTSWNAENNPAALQHLLNQQCQMRFEFLLDTEHYSINKISSNHKRNIKKSVKANAEVSFPVDSEAIESHIELVNANLSEKGVGGLTNSPDYFQLIVDQGAGLLVQVKTGDQLLASTFFYTNDDYCYYHSSGTDERGKQIGAAHFLVDRMIAEMHRRKIRYLNLGGCTSDQAGLYRFKLGFRPETRMLLSAKRRLVSDGRHKLRSLLSIKPGDILKRASIQVFVKSTSEQLPETENDYFFSKLSFDTLFLAVASNPEMSHGLELFCNTGSFCYGLYTNKEKLIALGFISTVDDDENAATTNNSEASYLAEIVNVYVIQEMRNRGVGAALVSHLEAEVTRLGCSRVYCRIDSRNTAAQRLFLAQGFRNMGGETSISTALMPGKQRTIGKVQI